MITSKSPQEETLEHILVQILATLSTHHSKIYNSREDKREILKRKRFIRTHPVYHNVLIKSSKSHVELVMDSNLNVVRKEMTNDNTYYISDNGRITPMNRLTYRNGHTDGNYQSSGNHGGAISKNFRDQENQQDRFDKHQHIME